MASIPVDIIEEGTGPDTIVMVHGWPDTHHLWDPQVAAFKAHYRCVRFTLPGFDITRPIDRAYSLDEVIDTLRAVIDQVSPGRPVILLVHDWGCFFGYQYLMRHPDRVKRLVGVDIGDAGSHHNLKEMGAKGKLGAVAYQLTLATAWKLRGSVGDAIARRTAKLFRAPAPQERIGAQMGYPYAVQWFKEAGGFGRPRAFVPPCPMLFFYGQRKPFMFHSRAWAEKLAAQPGNRVVGLPTGHWVMVGRPAEFNAAVLDWLASGAAAPAATAAGPMPEAAAPRS
ncbi:alpha/beta fold hydrolase [Aquincola sp. J276]|uniref:alpha/beta fold hydrolase n=1 Tax=Aquincola sp. J276 TaxID=2898432 RepID=UPI00215121EB|nr:alpha/beta hydrolase [Aquincola sp. J276]MCR5863937.1 alpha/beta hydrolase [Aquincola sp. J276]